MTHREAGAGKRERPHGTDRYNDSTPTYRHTESQTRRYTDSHRVCVSGLWVNPDEHRYMYAAAAHWHRPPPTDAATRLPRSTALSAGHQQRCDICEGICAAGVARRGIERPLRRRGGRRLRRRRPRTHHSDSSETRPRPRAAAMRSGSGQQQRAQPQELRGPMTANQITGARRAVMMGDARCACQMGRKGGGKTSERRRGRRGGGVSDGRSMSRWGNEARRSDGAGP
jgi:hypothetical protein